MAITKIQSESLNLADTYAFTGTVTGAGETNSPYFRAYVTSASDISSNSTTKVEFDTLSWNVGGTYSTTDFRWTPGVQGKYLINAQVTMNWSDSAGDRIDLLIRKNGSNVNYRRVGSGGNFGVESSTVISATVDLDSNDYVEVFVTVNTVSGGAARVNGETTQTWFNGFKLA